MAATQVIATAANPLIKSVRKAVARGTTTDDGFVVADSFHLLEEALRSDLPVPVVLAARAVEAAVHRHVGKLAGVRVNVVEDRLLQQISSTQTSQGVIALVRLPVWRLDDLFRKRSLVVVLDGLQDPGNAGATVRSAEAFGATGVAFLSGSASPENPKTLRASGGSLFRVPHVAKLDPQVVRAALRQRRIKVYAASPRYGTMASRAPLTGSIALVVGSEARGVGEVFGRSSKPVRISVTKVESLNAAVAASILLYEAARQRSLVDEPVVEKQGAA